MSSAPQPPADDRPAGLAELSGDEAVLPAGSRLADEKRPGHQCFVIIEGTATVERDGSTLRRLDSGAFVGELAPDGHPLPPSGVTVRLDTRSRVLVLDAARLAAAIDADPAVAAAWRSLTGRTPSGAANEPPSRPDRVTSTGICNGGPQ